MANQTYLSRCAEAVHDYTMQKFRDGYRLQSFAGEPFAAARSAGHSLEEIAEACGITRERVRQVIAAYGRTIHNEV